MVFLLSRSIQRRALCYITKQSFKQEEKILRFFVNFLRFILCIQINVVYLYCNQKQTTL